MGFRVIDRNISEITIREESVGHLNHFRDSCSAMRELKNLNLRKRVNSGRPTESYPGSYNDPQAPKAKKDQVEPLIYTTQNDRYL